MVTTGPDDLVKGFDLELGALTPLDGRYRQRIAGLADLFGEGALIRYRLKVESAWLLHLAAIPAVAAGMPLGEETRRLLAASCLDGVPGDAERRVKDFEAKTNHDVKAIEYFMRERLEAAGASRGLLSHIHFACTSEDINNLAYGLMLKDWRDGRARREIDRIIVDLGMKASAFAAIPMLARTHGQTASPTTLGKELAVFGHRLMRQRTRFLAQPIEGKINGAVGNYNAHYAAFPAVDWPQVAESFVSQRLGLSWNPLTTQIENHDSLVELFSIVSHFSTIAIGLCRDVWGYVSLGYFGQKTIKGEVGSSTMPHKVNPIDFENAEGNFGLVQALAQHFGEKLPISRWQRDLSDSTVLRALGTAVGHFELALRSLAKGLGKLEVNPKRLASDLADAQEVLAEPIQTMLRRYGVIDAYERLKDATRGQVVTRAALMKLVDDAPELPASAKAELKDLTPELYVGSAAALAQAFAAMAERLAAGLSL